MFEGLPPYAMHVIASAAVLLVAGVNYFGLELNAELAINLLFVQIALLGVFVGFAEPAVDASNLAPVWGSGIASVLRGAAIFFWSWDGFMRMAIMASEVKDPKRTIPFAIIGGIALAAIVFLAVGTAALGVLGADGMSGGDTPNDTPLLQAGAKAIGGWGMWLVLATAWLDTLTQAHGDLLTLTRVALAMGKQSEQPTRLGWGPTGLSSPHPPVINP